MSKLTQLNKLSKSILNTIETSVEKKGVKSDHTNAKVIKVKDDNLAFNLEGGRYLTEISFDYLIDNRGYQYDYTVLELGELALLADYCTKQK